MKIYNYHPIYKYVISCTDADESPLEPGIFLIPAHATEVEPPKCENNQIQIFTENGWELITNHIGIYYDKETQKEFEWNNPFVEPENGTKNPPPKVDSEFLVKWEGEEWVIIESKVGTYYNILTGEKIINEDPHNEPDKSTKEPPPEVSDGYGVMWDDGWKIIEIPKPKELTPEEKLAQAGLTVEELKKLLGLS
jgi:hypothetical protein